MSDNGRIAGKGERDRAAGSVSPDGADPFPGGAADRAAIPGGRTTAGRVVLIVLLVLGLSGLHYLTAARDGYLHVVYREFYFLPIITAGFWFGLRGGFLTAVAVALLYLPTIAGNGATFGAHDLGNVLQVVLFLVVGLLTGALRDRELQQQRLREREAELSAMGAAAACVAHDLKAPLVAIGGFTRLVRRKIAHDEASAAKLDLVIQQTKRLEALVADMLVFSRPLHIAPRRNRLNDLLRQTALLCGEKAGAGKVELRLCCFREEEHWDFDFDRLQQALINLVDNAIEACGEAGEVIVRGFCEKNSAVIEVEDTGAGIPAGMQGCLFTPFVSGKRKGTGLGLPIVQKIVAAHGGSLEYRSGRHAGTVFSVRLPRA